MLTFVVWDQIGRVEVQSAQYAYHYAHVFYIVKTGVSVVYGSVRLDDNSLIEVCTEFRNGLRLRHGEVEVMRVDGLSTTASKGFRAYLNDALIGRQQTVPYVHQQLGHAESAICRLTSTAVTLMLQAPPAGAPANQWFSALVCASKAHAACVSRQHPGEPASSGADRMGVETNLSNNMFPFWSLVQFVLDKSVRHGKFSAKAAIGSYVNAGVQNTDAIKVWYPAANRFVEVGGSCCVHLHEVIQPSLHASVTMPKEDVLAGPAPQPAPPAAAELDKPLPAKTVLASSDVAPGLRNRLRVGRRGPASVLMARRRRARRAPAAAAGARDCAAALRAALARLARPRRAHPRAPPREEARRRDQGASREPAARRRGARQAAQRGAGRPASGGGARHRSRDDPGDAERAAGAHARARGRPARAGAKRRPHRGAARELSCARFYHPTPTGASVFDVDHSVVSLAQLKALVVEPVQPVKYDASVVHVYSGPSGLKDSLDTQCAERGAVRVISIDHDPTLHGGEPTTSSRASATSLPTSGSSRASSTAPSWAW